MRHRGIPTVSFPTVHKSGGENAFTSGDDLLKWPHDLAKEKGERLAASSSSTKSIVSAHGPSEFHRHGPHPIMVSGKRG